MSAPDPAFADPTFPGLSVRDLARRAADALQGSADNENRSLRHRDYVIRQDLSRLDREMLLDLGLDRDRS
ncbi:hypothetical protein [Ferruginivarius sediminum]|uniref:DUF1127 domain-containing protein n=1 Tax=Ferruginivarius sediminum TaxID=2661937 RepID=A0A369TED8_9PROT|nr:hypothetical protein [Ferruginivarius sediminum]RDD63699.1 hypothetical protein DRB17_00515 [Ferruginivarius sediminum]